MDAILLKCKKDSTMQDSNLVVFDEIIAGMITDELFVPVFTGSDKGMRFIQLSYLIENFDFPITNGQIKVRLLHFLAGQNPDLYDKVNFYKTVEIEF